MKGVWGTGMVGETCTECDRTEQACAYNYPCCVNCGHWSDLDAHGNPKPAPPPAELGQALPLGLVCGTEVGYQRHKYRRDLSCEPCRRAHAAHVSRRRSQVPAQRVAAQVSRRSNYPETVGSIGA